ncbi:CBS domain-containing protein [Gilvibacter sp. SZ-19]|jgi:CBS domain-containing protein|uniref:CBS domain-containing protein n=1 Tax=unclassified Gilvibacter TaxID=2625242 RepID=UPI000B3CE1D7|nr:CBS domain-containing protein [Gilvibacter sp. SZ-19]ARV13370.1 CBS domain-containing protein [Gilvibacter sp. SZ-19]
MKKREPISKIMTPNIKTVNQTNTLYDVKDMLEEEQFHHVPVVSGDKVVGMLSKTDLQKISFINTVDGQGLTTAMYDALTIEQVMTKDVETVQKTDTIHDVAVTLAKNQFHALPVMDGDKLTGIVTTTDLIDYLIEQYN